VKRRLFFTSNPNLARNIPVLTPHEHGCN